MLKQGTLTRKMTATFTAFALAATLAPAVVAPGQAHADEPAQLRAVSTLTAQEAPELEAQSYASNTVFANAQTIGLNQSVVGTFDYDADGHWEDYFYKFKTSNRRATYRVTLDSLSGRETYCQVVTEHNDRWGGSGSSLWTSTRSYVSKDDCDYNSWFYIKVSHYAAKRYDQYRITVEELPYATDFSIGGIAGSYAYTGNDICPKPSVSYYGRRLNLNQDYTLSWDNNKSLGTATVTIWGTGKYSGSVSKTFNIVTAKNRMTAKARKATVKVSRAKLRNSWSSYTLNNNVNVKRAKGSITYENASKAKKARNLYVNSYNGNVSIPRDAKKGTYKIRIRVNDAGTYGYKAKTAFATYRIKIV